MPQHTSPLPLPDLITAQHAETVKFYLNDLILKKSEHKITFAEYMQQVLYAPALGYYAAGNRKFGKEGDFITAPEISPLFSQCLALQIKQILAQLQEGVILEFGAGSGKMALEIMRTLAAQNSLPTAYYILEISAELQQRQRQFIQQNAPELFSYFNWLTALPDIPIKGVIIANEVLDAMPCHRFCLQNNTIQEYYVTCKNDELSWCLDQPSTAELTAKITELNLCPTTNYTSEINLIHPAWIHSVSDCLQQGLILLIDYGYPQAEFYHPLRNTGTLKCFFRHHQHEDPLILTGIQDITAHVNFTAIAHAAIAADLEVKGYLNQASFLINCGIERLLTKIENERDYINAVQQIKKLTLPTEMGELFKVMALSRRIDFGLLGFNDFSRLPNL